MWLNVRMEESVLLFAILHFELYLINHDLESKDQYDRLWKSVMHYSTVWLPFKWTEIVLEESGIQKVPFHGLTTLILQCI